MTEFVITIKLSKDLLRVLQGTPQNLPIYMQDYAIFVFINNIYYMLISRNTSF